MKIVQKLKKFKGVKVFAVATIAIALLATAAMATDLLNFGAEPIEARTSWVRFPAEYETATPDSTSTRFNAVTGQFVYASPWAPQDFSAFPLVPLEVNTHGWNLGVNTDNWAHFRLDPVSQTAELAYFPVRAGGGSGSTITVPAGSQVTIPATVEYNGTTYTVVSVGPRATRGFGTTFGGTIRTVGWETINLPNTVTHVREEAFLFTITPTINMSTNVVYIGDRAFDWRGNGATTAARAITISPQAMPEGLKEIGQAVFDQRNIPATNLAFPQSLEITSVPRNASGDIVIASNSGGSFAGLMGTGTLGTLNLPPTWVYVPPAAFAAHQTRNWFADVHMPDSITHIMQGAFQFRGGIQNITWSSNIVYVGESAFNGAVVSVSPGIDPFGPLYDTLTRVGNFAFASFNMGYSTNLRIPPNIEYMGVGVFEGSGFSWDNGTVMPDDWTVIPARTFSNMRNVQNAELQLPADLRYIGASAFHRGGFAAILHPDTSGLGFIEMNVPANLEYIGNYAFARQASFRGDLILPNGLLHIGARAFQSGGWDGVLYVPRSVISFGYVPGVMNVGDYPVPLSRPWEGAQFYRTDHHRFVRQMIGSLPCIEERFLDDLPPDVSDWEDTYVISETNPVLYKSARWTNANLTEAEIFFQYGALVPYTLKFDFIFVLDMSSSMVDIIDAEYDGVEYITLGWLVLRDLLGDAVEIILEGNENGYDNRVAFTAFGGAGGTPANIEANAFNMAFNFWNTTGEPSTDSGFTADGAVLENAFRTNPHTVLGSNTNYGIGLDSAIQMINDRTDDSRQPVVIVIGDGEPFPILPSFANEALATPGQVASNVQHRATIQSNWLRDNGIPLFPLGVFLELNEGTIRADRARDHLRSMSFDQQSFWLADNTEEFVEALREIVEDSVTILPPTVITDYLSNFFELRDGATTNYVASAGVFTITDPVTGRFTWDLTGVDTGRIHTLLVELSLRSQYHTEVPGTGSLPTNSLTTEPNDSIETTSSPHLQRWIVTHEFVCPLGYPLPQEIIDLTPVNRGGYRDGAVVSPTTNFPMTVVVGGVTWYFQGWDRVTCAINQDNVHFIGRWCLTPPGPPLTKTLQFPEGIAVPEVSFYFSFETTRIVLSDDPLIQSVPEGQVPNIDDQYISFTSTDTTVTAGSGNVTVTRTLSPTLLSILQDLLDAGEFDHAGVYVWTVEEIVNSSSTNANTTSTMTYSQAKFEMRVWIGNTADGGLAISSIEIIPLRDDSGEYLENAPKRGSMEFLNIYTPDIGEVDLEIEKRVTGDYANLNTDFQFTLVLTPPAEGTFPILNTAGATVGTVDITLAGPNVFYLRHGQRLVISGLPVGTTFSVTESAHPEFAPEVSVVIGGTEIHTDSRVANNPLPSGTHTLANEGENEVVFTNDHRYAPPTGLIAGSTFFVAATMITAVVTSMFIASKKRRSIEELAFSYDFKSVGR